MPAPNGPAQDLIVTDTDRVSLFVNDGTGDFTNGGFHGAPLGELYRHMNVAFFPIDEDARPDVVGATDTQLSAVLTDAPPGGPLPVDVPFDLPDSTADDMLVDFDDDGRMDVIVLDDEEGIGLSKLVVYEDIRLDGDELVSTTFPVEHAFASDLHPDFLVAADFDQDGSIEILAFDRTGRNVCVRLDQAGLVSVVCECQRDCP